MTAHIAETSAAQIAYEEGYRAGWNAYAAQRVAAAKARVEGRKRETCIRSALEEEAPEGWEWRNNFHDEKEQKTYALFVDRAGEKHWIGYSTWTEERWVTPWQPISLDGLGSEES